MNKQTRAQVGITGRQTNASLRDSTADCLCPPGRDFQRERATWVEVTVGIQWSFQLQGRQAGRTVGEALGRVHGKTRLQGTGSMSCFRRGAGGPSSPDWREGRGPSLQGDAHSHLQGWGFGTSFSPGSHSEDPGILVKKFHRVHTQTMG